jgi:hypothetical protein
MLLNVYCTWQRAQDAAVLTCNMLILPATACILEHRSLQQLLSQHETANSAVTDSSSSVYTTEFWSELALYSALPWLLLLALYSQGVLWWSHVLTQQRRPSQSRMHTTAEQQSQRLWSVSKTVHRVFLAAVCCALVACVEALKQLLLLPLLNTATAATTASAAASTAAAAKSGSVQSGAQSSVMLSGAVYSAVAAVAVLNYESSRANGGSPFWFKLSNVPQNRNFGATTGSAQSYFNLPQRGLRNNTVTSLTVIGGALGVLSMRLYGKLLHFSVGVQLLADVSVLCTAVWSCKRTLPLYAAAAGAAAAAALLAAATYSNSSSSGSDSLLGNIEMNLQVGALVLTVGARGLAVLLIVLAAVTVLIPGMCTCYNLYLASVHNFASAVYQQFDRCSFQ